MEDGTWSRVNSAVTGKEDGVHTVPAMTSLRLAHTGIRTAGLATRHVRCQRRPVGPMGEEKISRETNAMLWDTTHPHTVATFLGEACGSGGVPLDFPGKQRLIERQFNGWSGVMRSAHVGTAVLLFHRVRVDVHQRTKRNVPVFVGSPDKPSGWSPITRSV
jgi:hypothetical protein